MKMIPTPAAVAANQYPAFVSNCLRNASCERSFAAPLPAVPYLQLYVDFGVDKPLTMDFQLIDHCSGGTEQIIPGNYVVGKTPEGGWYGVFKYFSPPVTPVTTFVVWLSVMALVPGGGVQERTFFSEMLVDEPCGPLTKIKSCQPELATTTGFDVNGIYYGLPVNLDFLGIPDVRYFHIAYVRQGKVREMSNKGTFKSSLIRNFRTVIEKVHQLETELVPKWYKNILLAIYARGVIQVNDGRTYLVSELNFDPLNDDDLTWKPFAQLKETWRLFFGCDQSECTEEVLTEDSSPDASASGGGGESVPDMSATAIIYWDLNNVVGANLTIKDQLSNVVLDEDSALFIKVGDLTGLSGAYTITGKWTSGAGNVIRMRVCDSFGQVFYDGSITVGEQGVVITDPLPSVFGPYYVFLTAGDIEPATCPPA